MTFIRNIVVGFFGFLYVLSLPVEFSCEAAECGNFFANVSDNVFLFCAVFAFKGPHEPLLKVFEPMLQKEL